ncbi:hypothetical protein MTR_4g132873 [Medicago truncatula]|uniref:Uncharacterized protein n=1 Tax=Medicago truncatula TaxID=3880 RepID=A0A072UTH0_MEDTR|nr:hypothetical protein MTR_4g132873 [Medicago truncatula]
MHVVPIRASSPQLIEHRLSTCQTKATGKLTRLSKTFMFTPKANSKQKRAKQTQEHETGSSATELSPGEKIIRHGELNLIALRNLTFFTQKSHF